MDYSRGKIYLIRNRNNDNLIYVGSTIEQYLSKRLQKHKSQKSCSLYYFINNPENNTNWDDWYIELYEDYPCNSKLQLVKRENEIIREKATINKIGYRTEEMKKQQDKEYRDTHKEEIKERNKRYVENNRDKVLKKKAEYYEKNRERLSDYMKERYQQKREEIIEKQKHYIENNKEKVLESKKQYYEKNKERIKEKEKNQKFKCECGSCVRYIDRSQHFKTKKHIDYIALLK